MDVLECLRLHGQCMDLQIAEETGQTLASVRHQLDDLAGKGAIIQCRVTRFDRGTAIDARQCRIGGYLPPKAPGRKATSAA